jgi:ribosomal protein S18 acetylase RimI-like enzyme
MSSAENDVRPAVPEEVPALARVLARGFVDDPIMRWTVPAEDHLERVRVFFEVFDLRTAAEGWLWTVDDGAGAALWVPPGTEAEFDEMTFSLEDVVREMLGDLNERYDEFWGWAEGMRPAEPHWYLDHIAVDPARQGSGLGGALVAHGLALAEAAGMPAFLNTARVGNVRFYERRGFEVIESSDAPGGGPRIWFMVHPA